MDAGRRGATEEAGVTWIFYTTASGREVVKEEIKDTLGQGPPRKELGALMTRISYGRAFPRDVNALGDGLLEARLSNEGNEYRLYYAHGPKGQAVLLGLAFHMKGGRGAQDRVIAVARKRLADWLGRI